MDILDEFQKELELFHEKAMNLAEEAFFLKREKKDAEAVEKFNAAFQLEKEVANAYIQSKKDVKDIEPSRTVICMSAAVLAHDAGLINYAKKYAQAVIDYNMYEEYVNDAKEIINE